MRIQDVWNGAASGLLGEVVVEDCYRLREVDFDCDLFFDIGANIGIASRYARKLFPNCVVIAVEPDPDNIKIFKRFTNDEKIILIEKAVGKGNLWHGTTAANGSGETYLSEGLGYSKKAMEARNGSGIERTQIETIMPDEIINTYLKEGMKSILKMDIEGAENIVLTHKPSMDALKRIDYLCFEIHNYAIDGFEHKDVLCKTEKALNSFSETHSIVIEGVHFYATKKRI